MERPWDDTLMPADAGEAKVPLILSGSQRSRQGIGPGVGFVLGLGEGPAVGLSVGSFVGVDVGLLGAMVGPGVGFGLGLGEGPTVGLSVGSLVGVDVGSVGLGRRGCWSVGRPT